MADHINSKPMGTADSQRWKKRRDHSTMSHIEMSGASRHYFRVWVLEHTRRRIVVLESENMERVNVAASLPLWDQSHGVRNWPRNQKYTDPEFVALKWIIFGRLNPHLITTHFEKFWVISYPLQFFPFFHEKILFEISTLFLLHSIVISESLNLE